MQFRATDEEIFEDDPEEFIRRDIEGSGAKTTRRGFDSSSCFVFRSTLHTPPCLPVPHSPYPFPDIETRRRAAYDLVRGLCKCFEAEVTGVFSEYVTQLLAVRLSWWTKRNFPPPRLY